MGDESLACMSWMTADGADGIHHVSFDDRFGMDLPPKGLVTFVILKSADRHVARFMVNDQVIQTIHFDFLDHPDQDICFRYDGIQGIWLTDWAPKPMCQGCETPGAGN